MSNQNNHIKTQTAPQNPDKLKELTHKLYQEGIEKANREAELLLQKAQTKAQEIIQRAENQALETLDTAKKQSGQVRRMAENELKLAGTKMLNSLKQEISEVISQKLTAETTRKVFADTKYLKKLIQQGLERWSKDPFQQNEPLRILIPSNQEEEIFEHFKGSALHVLDTTLEISADPDLEGGFKIGPQDGRYILEFSQEAFQNLLKLYLRPQLYTLLFSSANAPDQA